MYSIAAFQHACILLLGWREGHLACQLEKPVGPSPAWLHRRQGFVVIKRNSQCLAKPW